MIFGFGKKKVSAYKYAINLVTLSLTMKNQFASFWNSIRHKAELDVLDENDPDLVLLFDTYNMFHIQLKDFCKLEEKNEIGAFGGIARVMYSDLYIESNPDLENFDINKFFKKSTNTFNEFHKFLNANPDGSFLLVMCYFFMSLKDIKYEENEKYMAFAEELSELFELASKEGWAIIRDSKEAPYLDDESLSYFNNTKKKHDLII
jgi:sugar phosphate isomerase/epimerase